jgi:hypothetical protein
VPVYPSRSDALVFFGATGDLAYTKIFPSLQSMAKRGNLNVPVIGVAKAGLNLDQLKARAKDSLEAFPVVGETVTPASGRSSRPPPTPRSSDRPACAPVHQSMASLT